MRTKRIVCLLLAWVGVARAASPAWDAQHKLWTTWLHEYVTQNGPQSTVDYKRAKRRPEALGAYLATVEAVTRDQYDHFTEADKLAFLINAYNAFTVKLIVDHYPVKSIKDIGGLFSSPWNIAAFRVLGEKRSLGWIEHENLRKQFAEPRIHFAIVCASRGCPPLQREAFVGLRLDAQLDAATLLFLRDPAHNRYDAGEDRFHVSKIFDWFGDDFVKKYGSVQEFLAARMFSTISDRPKGKKTSLTYQDYDWSLNETASKPTP